MDAIQILQDIEVKLNEHMRLISRPAATPRGPRMRATCRAAMAHEALNRNAGSSEGMRAQLSLVRSIMRQVGMANGRACPPAAVLLRSNVCSAAQNAVAQHGAPLSTVVGRGAMWHNAFRDVHETLLFTAFCDTRETLFFYRVSRRVPNPGSVFGYHWENPEHSKIQ